jgi:hypothetical protein
MNSVDKYKAWIKEKLDKYDKRKLRDQAAVKAAARDRKTGKAGPHSVKGYSRKTKHKGKNDDGS